MIAITTNHLGLKQVQIIWGLLKTKCFISPQFPNKFWSQTGNKYSEKFGLLNDAIPEVYQTHILHNGE